MSDNEKLKMAEDKLQAQHGKTMLHVCPKSEEFEDEVLDPRIQFELEKLNKASADINKIELELDDARSSFRLVLSDSIQKLNALANKLGSCVEKARPYYEARHKASEYHMETQKAALRYERACSMHEAAKEMVQLAEQGYQRREQDADPAWQEMLNHATMKVNEAETERIDSEAEHQRTMTAFKESETKVMSLQKELKRAITKSKPYFEMKARFNQLMEDLKCRVGGLEEEIGSSKSLYSQALHSLEDISEEIHRNRLEKQKKMQLGVRGIGVGAECPLPPPPPIRMDGKVASHTSSCDLLFDKSKNSSPNNIDSIDSLPTSTEKCDTELINPSSKSLDSFEDYLNNAKHEEEYLDLPTQTKKLIRTKDMDFKGSNSQINSEICTLRSCSDEKKFESVPINSDISEILTKKLENDSPLINQKHKSKLKGLILRINPDEFNPDGAASMKSTDNQSASIKKSSVPLKCKSGNVFNKSQKESYGDNFNMESLQLPDLDESVEYNSDTESIASAGPMLDDEQVEYLTLDFKDTMHHEIQNSTSSTTDWSGLQLPHSMNHLENFLDTKSKNLLKISSESPGNENL